MGIDFRRRLLLLMLCSGATSACASSPAQIRVALDPWVGQGISTLIARWGPPSSVFEMPTGGGKVYSWLYQGDTQVRSYYFPRLEVGTASAETPICRFDWTTDAAGRILAYRWEGDCSVHKEK